MVTWWLVTLTGVSSDRQLLGFCPFPDFDFEFWLVPVDTVCQWLTKVRSRPRAEALPCALPGDPLPALPAWRTSLFPNICHSSGRQLWPPGAGPTPLVTVCWVKELEGSPMKQYGSKAAPPRGQRRGAGAEERSPCSSCMSLPGPVGKTHRSVCMQSIPGTHEHLHREVFIVGFGGGAWAEGSPLWAELQGRQGWWGSGVERRACWGVSLFRSGLGLNENSKYNGQSAALVQGRKEALAWFWFRFGLTDYIQEILPLCSPVSDPAGLNSDLAKLHYLNLVCCIQPGIKMHVSFKFDMKTAVCIFPCL